MNSLSDLLTDRADDFNVDMTAKDTSMVSSHTPQPVSTPTIDIQQLQSSIYTIKDQLDGMLRALGGEQVRARRLQEADVQHTESGERIIEGVFNGQHMIGSDAREYTVPPNYASKSKLVEGDMMKLTITHNGSFIFKQIGQIGRKRIVGELVYHAENAQWSVLADGKPYKILIASVTFFKGRAGDEAVVLVPHDGHSDWGAVENIIQK